MNGASEASIEPHPRSPCADNASCSDFAALLSTGSGLRNRMNASRSCRESTGSSRSTLTSGFIE